MLVPDLIKQVTNKGEKVILEKIFVLSSTISVKEQSETIIRRLRSKYKSGFGTFANHSFKFMMIGKVGIHRLHESCYVSGTIQDTANGCTIYYSIYPGIIFWICGIINFLFLIGSLIGVITSKDSISNFFFKLLIINTMLLIIETLEIRHQEKWCNEKIENTVRGCLRESYEIT